MTDMAGPPVWLVLLRGAHDASILSFLGALGFAPFVLPRDLVGRLASSLRRLAWTSGAIALVLGILWFVVEAAMVAEVHGIGPTLSAVPAFIAYVRFGQVLAVRLLLIGATLVLVGQPQTALVPASVAVALQPWLGHAEQVGLGLTASEILHLLAANLWLGSLIPLLLCLRLLPVSDAARALRRFTRVGVPAVSVLAGTGIAQGFLLAGSTTGLIHTTYGRVALLKAALFALALAVAACNRLVLTPRLTRSIATSKPLQISIGTEVLTGTAIVLAAGWLANLAPG